MALEDGLPAGSGISIATIARNDHLRQRAELFLRRVGIVVGYSSLQFTVTNTNNHSNHQCLTTIFWDTHIHDQQLANSDTLLWLVISLFLTMTKHHSSSFALK